MSILKIRVKKKKMWSSNEGIKSIFLYPVSCLCWCEFHFFVRSHLILMYNSNLSSIAVIGKGRGHGPFDQTYSFVILCRCPIQKSKGIMACTNFINKSTCKVSNFKSVNMFKQESNGNRPQYIVV